MYPKDRLSLLSSPDHVKSVISQHSHPPSSYNAPTILHDLEELTKLIPSNNHTLTTSELSSLDLLFDYFANFLQQLRSENLITINYETLPPTLRSAPRRFLRSSERFLRITAATGEDTQSLMRATEELGLLVGLSLFKSPVLETKKEGLTIFSKFVVQPVHPHLQLYELPLLMKQGATFTTPNALAECFRREGVIQAIFGPQSHVSLISQFSRVFLYLVEKREITVPELATLWDTHFVQRTAENKDVVKLLKRCIDALSDGDFLFFVNTILMSSEELSKASFTDLTSSFPSHISTKLTAEHISFLVSFLLSKEASPHFADFFAFLLQFVIDDPKLQFAHPIPHNLFLQTINDISSSLQFLRTVEGPDIVARELYRLASSSKSLPQVQLLFNGLQKQNPQYQYNFYSVVLQHCPDLLFDSVFFWGDYQQRVREALSFSHRMDAQAADPPLVPSFFVPHYDPTVSFQHPTEKEPTDEPGKPNCLIVNPKLLPVSDHILTRFTYREALSYIFQLINQLIACTLHIPNYLDLATLIWDYSVVGAMVEDEQTIALVSLTTLQNRHFHLGSELLWSRALCVDPATRKDQPNVLPLSPSSIPPPALSFILESFSKVVPTAIINSPLKRSIFVNYVWEAAVHAGVPIFPPPGQTEWTGRSVNRLRKRTSKSDPSNVLWKVVLAAVSESGHRSKTEAPDRTLSDILVRSLGVLSSLSFDSTGTLSFEEARSVLKAENAANLIFFLLQKYDCSIPPQKRKAIQRHGPLMTRPYVLQTYVSVHQGTSKTIETMTEIDCVQSLREAATTLLKSAAPHLVRIAHNNHPIQDRVDPIFIYPANTVFLVSQGYNLPFDRQSSAHLFPFSNLPHMNHPAFFLSHNLDLLTAASNFSPSLNETCSTIIRRIPSSPRIRKALALSDGPSLTSLFTVTTTDFQVNNPSLLYTLQVLNSFIKETASQKTQQLLDADQTDVSTESVQVPHAIPGQTLTITFSAQEGGEVVFTDEHFRISDWRSRFVQNGGLLCLIKLLFQIVSDMMNTPTFTYEITKSTLNLVAVVTTLLLEFVKSRAGSSMKALLEQMVKEDVHLPFTPQTFSTFAPRTSCFTLNTDMTALDLSALVSLVLSILHVACLLGTGINVPLASPESRTIPIMSPFHTTATAPFSFLTLDDDSFTSFLNPQSIQQFQTSLLSHSDSFDSQAFIAAVGSNTISHLDGSPERADLFESLIVLFGLISKMHITTVIPLLFSPTLCLYATPLLVANLTPPVLKTCRKVIDFLSKEEFPSDLLPPSSFSMQLVNHILSFIPFLSTLSSSPPLFEEQTRTLCNSFTSHPSFQAYPHVFVFFSAQPRSLTRLVKVLIFQLSQHVPTDSFVTPDPFLNIVSSILPPLLRKLNTITPTEIDNVILDPQNSLLQYLLNVFFHPRSDRPDLCIHHPTTRKHVASLLSVFNSLTKQSHIALSTGIGMCYSEVIQPVLMNPPTMDTTCGPRILPFAGLKNLGATCYINSVLQQLFMHTPLRYTLFSHTPTMPDEIDEDSYPPPCRERMSMRRRERESVDFWIHLQKLYAHLQETRLSSIDTAEFARHVIRNGQPINVLFQEDSVEFLTTVMDKLETVLAMDNLPNAVQRFFYGCFDQKIVGVCGHVSQTKQPFNLLTVDIKERSLLKALEVANEADAIGGDSGYRCSVCGNQGEAFKRTLLSELPNTLFIQLKRFDHNYDTNEDTKLNDYFDFPLDELDLTKFLQSTFDKRESTMDGEQLFMSIKGASTKKTEEEQTEEERNESAVYRLMGVVVHMGDARGGHYYSLIRVSAEAGGVEEWYEFNDRQVTLFNPGDLADVCFGGEDYESSYDYTTNEYVDTPIPKTHSAYILIYQRNTPLDEWEQTPSFVADEEAGFVEKKQKEAKALKEKEMQAVLDETDDEDLRVAIQMSFAENEAEQDVPIPKLNMEGIPHYSLSKSQGNVAVAPVPSHLSGEIGKLNSVLVQNALFSSDEFFQLIRAMWNTESESLGKASSASEQAITPIWFQYFLHSSKEQTDVMGKRYAEMETIFMQRHHNAVQFLAFLVREMEDERKEGATIQSTFTSYLFRSSDERMYFLRLVLTAMACTLDELLKKLTSKPQELPTNQNLLVLSRFVALVIQLFIGRRSCGLPMITLISLLNDFALLSPHSSAILASHHVAYHLSRFVKDDYSSKDKDDIPDTWRKSTHLSVSQCIFACVKSLAIVESDSWVSTIRLVGKQLQQQYNIAQPDYSSDLRNFKQHVTPDLGSYLDTVQPTNIPLLHPLNLSLLPSSVMRMYDVSGREMAELVYLACLHDPNFILVWIRWILSNMTGDLNISDYIHIFLGLLVSMLNGLETRTIQLTIDFDLSGMFSTFLLQMVSLVSFTWCVPPLFIVSEYMRISKPLSLLVSEHNDLLMELLLGTTNQWVAESISRCIRFSGSQNNGIIKKSSKHKQYPLLLLSYVLADTPLHTAPTIHGVPAAPLNVVPSHLSFLSSPFFEDSQLPFLLFASDSSLLHSPPGLTKATKSQERIVLPAAFTPLSHSSQPMSSVFTDAIRSKFKSDKPFEATGDTLKLETDAKNLLPNYPATPITQQLLAASAKLLSLTERHKTRPEASVNLCLRVSYTYTGYNCDAQFIALLYQSALEKLNNLVTKSFSNDPSELDSLTNTLSGVGAFCFFNLLWWLTPSVYDDPTVFNKSIHYLLPLMHLMTFTSTPGIPPAMTLCSIHTLLTHLIANHQPAVAALTSTDEGIEKVLGLFHLDQYFHTSASPIIQHTLHLNIDALLIAFAHLPSVISKVFENDTFTDVYLQGAVHITQTECALTRLTIQTLVHYSPRLALHFLAHLQTLKGIQSHERIDVLCQLLPFLFDSRLQLAFDRAPFIESGILRLNHSGSNTSLPPIPLNSPQYVQYVRSSFAHPLPDPPKAVMDMRTEFITTLHNHNYLAEVVNFFKENALQPHLKDAWAGSGINSRAWHHIDLLHHFFVHVYPSFTSQQSKLTQQRLFPLILQNLFAHADVHQPLHIRISALRVLRCMTSHAPSRRAIIVAFRRGFQDRLKLPSHIDRQSDSDEDDDFIGRLQIDRFNPHHVLQRPVLTLETSHIPYEIADAERFQQEQMRKTGFTIIAGQKHEAFSTPYVCTCHLNSFCPHHPSTHFKTVHMPSPLIISSDLEIQNVHVEESLSLFIQAIEEETQTQQEQSEVTKDMATAVTSLLFLLSDSIMPSIVRPFREYTDHRGHSFHRLEQYVGDFLPLLWRHDQFVVIDAFYSPVAVIHAHLLFPLSLPPEFHEKLVISISHFATSKDPALQSFIQTIVNALAQDLGNLSLRLQTDLNESKLSLERNAQTFDVAFAREQRCGEFLESLQGMDVVSQEHKRYLVPKAQSVSMLRYLLTATIASLLPFVSRSIRRCFNQSNQQTIQVALDCLNKMDPDDELTPHVAQLTNAWNVINAPR
ncbi:putative Ubiquitin carboxyl-terminal hydrolase 34 [Blattamonas nauphoetae]|uniref:Ubiquitin carboxyl-terminal hydrolase 34 n=1 Tax=Blattamonas nauphoetae TaxID=2049346 RepID=A0ABQ9WZ61_9EUKA|nr:putative Ubiquitin carboxyl-terminal hydrolase 34 [Blattamonas nauphoetae]